MVEGATYKNRKIEVHELPEGSSGRGNEPGEAHGLFVDGVFVPTERHPSGRFWTRLLPYADYESLAHVGRALIDHSQI